MDDFRKVFDGISDEFDRWPPRCCDALFAVWADEKSADEALHEKIQKVYEAHYRPETRRAVF